MKIRELLFASIALFSIFAVPILGHCQDDVVVPGKTADGRVVSVDVQNSKIVVKSSDVITFFVPEDAKIINEDGFDMQLSDVKNGHYVTIDYHNGSSGSHIVDLMEVAYNR